MKYFNFECCGNCKYGRYGVKKNQAPWAVNCKLDGRNEAETFICLMYINNTNNSALSEGQKKLIKEALKICDNL